MLLAVRVLPSGPLEAQVHAERPGGAWRPVLTTRGPDALARAQDLARLLEVGLLAIAADAPPRVVSADEHPEPWVSLADAVRALRESPAATVARIERGELRTRDTPRGLYVRAEDLFDAAHGGYEEIAADYTTRWARAGLTDAQADGGACVLCGREVAIPGVVLPRDAMVPAGWVLEEDAEVQAFRCARRCAPARLA